MAALATADTVDTQLPNVPFFERDLIVQVVVLQTTIHLVNVVVSFTLPVPVHRKKKKNTERNVGKLWLQLPTDSSVALPLTHVKYQYATPMSMRIPKQLKWQR